MISIEKFDFKYLWKLDDEEWMRKRKEEWKFLAKNNYSEISAKEMKKYMDFYVYGKKESYIGECTEFLFIPYDSTECAREVFKSSFFAAHSRKQILNRFIFIASNNGKGLVWLRQHIKWFSEGVFGDRYKIIEEIDGKRVEIISPDPTFWTKQYIIAAIDVLKNKTDYHACVDCINYFVSALVYADDADGRRPKKILELMDLVNSVLEDNTYEGAVYEFARELKQKEALIWENWNKNSHLDQ